MNKIIKALVPKISEKNALLLEVGLGTIIVGVVCILALLNSPIYP